MSDINAKDLTKEAPRSAYEQIGGYAILARAIDKGRATIAGTNGEYNFDCPVDNLLLSFKGIQGSELRAQLEAGKTDEEIGAWLDSVGTPKTAEEKAQWAEHFKTDYTYATDPAKKDWFRGECARLGLDPDTTSLFSMLDADDKATFQG